MLSHSVRDSQRMGKKLLIGTGSLCIAASPSLVFVNFYVNFLFSLCLTEVEIKLSSDLISQLTFLGKY